VRDQVSHPYKTTGKTACGILRGDFINRWMFQLNKHMCVHGSLVLVTVNLSVSTVQFSHIPADSFSDVSCNSTEFCELYLLSSQLICQ
jgi:hexokinase